MNKESNLFNPTDLELSRSTFKYTPTISGTCMAGRLNPIWCFEVLPGDEINMNLNSLIKMSTPVYPTMDELFMDVSFFFVPNKLVLGRRYGSPAINDANQSWKAIIGAQDNLLNCPVPASGLELPTVYLDNFLELGSVADFLGVSARNGADEGYVNCLPFLGYVAIWNENFREPNISSPITWSFSNGNTVNLYGDVDLMVSHGELGAVSSYAYRNALDISSGSGPASPIALTYFYPLPTCVFHGFFGSLLPWPQRNSDVVELPLGDDAPVITKADGIYQNGQAYVPIQNLVASWDSGSSIYRVSGAPAVKSYPVNDQAANILDGTGASGDAGNNTPWVFNNLYADLSQATAANVNALRMAIQQQRWYEKLARSGNRYDELEYGLFGVRPHDSGDDRPLYLGGKRIPLKIEMVASTNGGTTSSSGQGAGSLGALGAFSHTNDSDHYFHHGFDDWGYLFCVMTIRHHTTFTNVLEKHWLRKSRDDYYWPTFAHLGEQAITKNLLDNDITDDSVLGYQEAWAEYRYSEDRVCGLLRGGSLDFMTYSEVFSDSGDLALLLDASKQIKSVDKTLAVDSRASGFQFVYQFNFDFTARRCMPQYSIPGMVDHF